MASNKGIARRSYELYENFRAQRSPWMQEVSMDSNYYWSNQWTLEEKNDLAMRGKAPLVFNIVRPHVDTKKGIITANRPAFRSIPRGDEDVGIASVWDNMLSYIWYISKGQMQFGEVIHDYCVPGIGWFMVDLDPFADEGNGEVIVRHVPYHHVYVDPTARLKDLSDARRIIVSVRIPREAAVLLYPDKKNLIKRATADGVDDWPDVTHTSESGIITPGSYDYTDRYTQDYVRIIELYELSYRPYYKVRYDPGMAPEYIEKAIFEKDTSAIVEAEEVLLKRCKRTTTVGQEHVIADEILPIDDFPLVPIVNVHTNTPYPHGDVREMRDPQNEKNKRRMVIINHAMSAGTNRTMAADGTVDVKMWERKAGIPGAVLTYTAMPNVDKPSPFPSEQLPNAFFAMEERSVRDAEYLTGIHPVMMGDPTNAPDTYRATLMMEETGTRRIRGNDMATIENALSRLGCVVLQVAQNHYTKEKIVRVIGENGAMTRFVVNQAELDDRGNMVRTTNDLSVGQFDVICVGGSTLPSNRMAQLEMYEQWYSMGLVDREAVLRKADLPDVDEILQRVGEVQQLQGALSQQGEEIKNLQGILQTLRRQLIQQDIKMTEKEYELLKQAELVAVQAQAKVAKALMVSRADSFAKSLTASQGMIEGQLRTKAQAHLEVLKARESKGEGSSE